MHKRIFLSLLAIASLTTNSEAQVQPLSPFQAGERACFVGNSITEAGYYESYIWLYYMLHFPGRKITVYNCGIGGDRAQNILGRIEADVFAKKPTTICVTFGMNDSGYFEYLSGNGDSTGKKRAQESQRYFDTISLKLKAYTAAKKIMITSSLYDETMKNPKNYFPKKSLSMNTIAAFQEKAAQDNHWGFVDFLHPMTEITLLEQRKDSAFTLTSSDRIHPGNAGHFVMAWLFLKQQGLAGKPVADIAIDAAAKKIQHAENCQLTCLSVTPGTIQVDYLANSLPFPQDTVSRMWENPQRQADALKVIPFTEEMNREMLTVHGLNNGNYSLLIDGKSIGKYSGEQLGAGINLALIKTTPQYDQAMTVLLLNEERMAIESRLRAYYWLQFNYLKEIGMQFNDNKVAMDSVASRATRDWAVASKRDNYRAARYAAVRASWQRQLDALVNEIYTLNQPKKHTIRIVKAD
ncbi:GDSL family lipase [Niastella yeongjuensis]|uniref:GDSL family lipase n=1 Tax=Niastella yeongjuensis TaxID=354355 RepID=A0A1V9E1P7_9BACT|nr:SGNH/GDSL hydrolase family protein [Niastella yeongjuensis]OQP40053.1 GDSL family lipase [Niastella yeongjuensis]SEO15037.1 GDSL-like Lipase/Acylhydrolase family [Niastella yeongjuensis]